MNNYLAGIAGGQVGITQKEPDGAFTDVQRAMDALREAHRAVSSLADELVGEQPTGDGEQGNEPYRCDGALGVLSSSASAAREIARDIISNIERIRRHAN